MISVYQQTLHNRRVVRQVWIRIRPYVVHVHHRTGQRVGNSVDNNNTNCIMPHNRWHPNTAAPSTCKSLQRLKDQIWNCHFKNTESEINIYLSIFSLYSLRVILFDCRAVKTYEYKSNKSLVRYVRAQLTDLDMFWLARRRSIVVTTPVHVDKFYR